jgi:hypothetical protein
VLKGDFMISLSEIWSDSITSAPEFAAVIEAYVNVQACPPSLDVLTIDRKHTKLNALMANATVAGTNVYGLNWSGPPNSTFTLAGMSGALSALVAAIGPAPNETVSTSSLTSSTPTAAPSGTAPVCTSSSLYPGESMLRTWQQGTTVFPEAP